jgi:hypothetical protein
LVAVDGSTATRIAKADPEFAAAFDDYQGEFACRALRYEIAESSLAETPELTLRLLADQVVGNYDPDDESAALADTAALPKSAPGPCWRDGRRTTGNGSSGPWRGRNGPIPYVRTTSSSPSAHRLP